MKVEITGNPQEIAALVVALQERQDQMELELNADGKSIALKAIDDMRAECQVSDER